MSIERDHNNEVLSALIDRAGYEPDNYAHMSSDYEDCVSFVMDGDEAAIGACSRLVNELRGDSERCVLVKAMRDAMVLPDGRIFFPSFRLKAEG